MKHGLYIILAAIALVGCSESDITSQTMPDGYLPSDTSISFKTEDNWGGDSAQAQTRGSIVDGDFKVGDAIGVFSYYHPQRVVSYANGADFMYDQEVTKQGADSWEYSPIKYWPRNGSLSFFAYAPYGANTIDASSGKPQFTHKLPNNVTDQIDLLIAAPKVDLTLADLASDSKVRLEFQHALACLNLTGSVTSQADESIEITKIVITGLKGQGVLGFDDSNALQTSGQSGDFTYTLNKKNGSLNIIEIKDILSSQTDKPSLLTENGHPMLIPQTVDTDAEIQVTVKKGTKQVEIITVKLEPIISTFESGKIYTINFNIAQTLVDVKITATVQSWEELTVNVPSFN